MAELNWLKSPSFLSSPSMTDADASTEHCSYYILNRDYFGECFDESANTPPRVKTYGKAIGLMIMAGVIYAMDIEICIAAANNKLNALVFSIGSHAMSISVGDSQ